MLINLDSIITNLGHTKYIFYYIFVIFITEPFWVKYMFCLMKNADHYSDFSILCRSDVISVVCIKF